MRDEEFIQYLKSENGVEFLMEAYFYGYIKEVTKTDEDGFQEVVLKLFETFKNFDFNNKNYDYINYYKLMICNWYKKYKSDNKTLASRRQLETINNIFKKDKNTLSEKENLALQNFNRLKNINSIDIQEYGKECYDTEYEIINNLEFENFISKLTEKEQDILDMKLRGYTIVEIGKKHNMTHQNISVILKKIFAK